MKVYVLIHSGGKEFNWDELSDDKKEEFRKRLNEQTAEALGYVPVLGKGVIANAGSS